MTLENYSDFGVRDLFESIHNKAKNFIKLQSNFRTPKYVFTRIFRIFYAIKERNLRVVLEILDTFFHCKKDFIKENWPHCVIWDERRRDIEMSWGCTRGLDTIQIPVSHQFVTNAPGSCNRHLKNPRSWPQSLHKSFSLLRNIFSENKTEKKTEMRLAFDLGRWSPVFLRMPQKFEAIFHSVMTSSNKNGR